MADLEKTRKNLEGRGFRVHRFASGAEAAEFLVQTLHGTSIGIGGSVTIDTLGVYDRLCGSNEVFWHWKNYAPETRERAGKAETYLCSANGVSENGEIVNIDGTGRRSVNNSIQKENILDVSDLTEWPVGRALLLASQSRAQIVKTLPWTGNRQWADALAQAKAQAREEQRKAA